VVDVHRSTITAKQTKEALMATEAQCERAERICRQLGARPPVPHGLYKVMLELVEADEKPGREEAPPARPVSDARKVLAPVKKHPKKVVEQEGLW
jgi:hypothetical protein